MNRNLRGPRRMSAMLEAAVACARPFVAGMIAVEEANAKQRVMDPAGDNPRCMNAVGTWNCAWCGRDVRGTTDACPSSPPERRWRVTYPPA